MYLRRCAIQIDVYHTLLTLRIRHGLLYERITALDSYRVIYGVRIRQKERETFAKLPAVKAYVHRKFPALYIRYCLLTQRLRRSLFYGSALNSI